MHENVKPSRSNPESNGSGSERRTAWLSKGFEVLAAELASRPPERDFDFEVVVIGSGYGGAVAAASLAALPGVKKGAVCVLERGREYLQGMFPTCLGELAEHVRFSDGGAVPKGARTGLFDLRLSTDVNALVASGLGGGSLINAGVMARPKAEVMQQTSWPEPIADEVKDGTMDSWFDEAERKLGAQLPDGSANEWPDVPLAKHDTLKDLSRKAFKKVALTIAFDDRPSAGGVALKRCVGCGDCAAGCNYGAKESLDTNLLAKAYRSGARLFTGATVLRLFKIPERGDRRSGWEIHVTHTDDNLRRRLQGCLTLRARRVVLAAGTLGSTEILLRSRAPKLNFSPRLGSNFSANGDMLAVLANLSKDVNCVADENVPPAERKTGPTITAMLDECGQPGSATKPRVDMVIQDLAVPAPLRPLFQQAVALADGFDTLSRGDPRPHDRGDRDPCAIEERDTKRAMLVAMMGHDGAEGRLELANPEGDDGRHEHGDGALRIVWPEANQDYRADSRQNRVEELQADLDSSARTLANPLWRVLPPQLEFLFGRARGPLFTVHPLGGCGMGDDVYRGVVNHMGQVYAGPPEPLDRALPHQFGSAVHPGLVVLDGSILPTSLGINPALSITALSLRAIDGLLSCSPEWMELKTRPAAAAAPPVAAQPEALARPFFRKIDPSTPPRLPKPTSIEIVERMSGEVRVKGFDEPLMAELTLQFAPADVAQLASPDAPKRVLDVDPRGSRLRLFERKAWKEVQRFPHKEPPDEKALWIAPIERGKLHLFQREKSGLCMRRLRALYAWFLNRGFRDSMQSLVDRIRGRDSPYEPTQPFLALIVERWQRTKKLLSLAGEARLLEYELELGKASKKHDRVVVANARLSARKRLTYNRRANPWRQLGEATLVSAPFKGVGSRHARLSLDLRFLVRRGVPLLRLIDQQDQVTALLGLGSLGMYLVRLLLRIHTWSFRKPDEATPREPQRLPGYMEGMPRPEIQHLAVTGASGEPAQIRLTRYRNDGPPVLMIHGYSASGTTFAHHATPSLARHLWQSGRDAWIVDMRTSAGMPTARAPWAFEEIANTDIPLAIDCVFQQTGKQPLDVVAHCMGSAMLCMALLGDQPTRGISDPRDPYNELREKLPERIRKLVLSQVTPITLFSPANLFRAFLMRYTRQFLDLDGYTFRVEGKPTMADQLFDRFLSTLPYPESEFDLENPPFAFWRRTPWTGTRHRMDALYGRDFNLKHMSEEMLEYIDDHFGPMSIETVSQAIHFARFHHLTDKSGNNRFVTRDRLEKRMRFPVLTLHGEENGLADVATANYMLELQLQRILPNLRVERIPGHGHQDCLIGIHAETVVFPRISSFLDAASDSVTRSPPTSERPAATPASKSIGQEGVVGPC
jgi:choline dehydrogenase-like flavoprotein